MFNYFLKKDSQNRESLENVNNIDYLDQASLTQPWPSSVLSYSR